MKKTVFGIVLKVKNLTSCKAFYRDVLDLGEPVQEGSFRVEFRCGDSLSLFLEKNLWEESDAVSNRISWFYGNGNAENIIRKIRAYGYSKVCTFLVENKADMPFCRFTDPEGNPFYVPAQNKPVKEKN